MIKIKKLKISFLNLIFIAIPTLALIFALTKVATNTDRPVYVKIKVSQGLWWASTQKPGAWFADSIQKGDEEYGLLGTPQARILDVRFYEVYEARYYESRGNIYLTTEILAGYNKRTKKYSFKRSNLVVGSPIEIETPKALISGTVLALSESPFEEKYVEKTITLFKNNAFPWEYDAINVGDKYFDGEDAVFVITNKYLSGTSYSVTGGVLGNITSESGYPTYFSSKKISVTAKIKVKETPGGLLYGEEKILKPGDIFPFTTQNFQFQDFYIQSIK